MLNKLRFQVHWYQRVFLLLKKKYNLDEDEVNLLNTLRDSDMTSEEFINSLVGLQNAVMYSSESRNQVLQIMMQYLMMEFR
jgi:hypothetical protein